MNVDINVNVDIDVNINRNVNVDTNMDINNDVEMKLWLRSELRLKLQLILKLWLKLIIIYFQTSGETLSQKLKYEICIYKQGVKLWEKPNEWSNSQQGGWVKIESPIEHSIKVVFTVPPNMKSWIYPLF